LTDVIPGRCEASNPESGAEKYNFWIPGLRLRRIPE
jgi:hypothetical protein